MKQKLLTLMTLILAISFIALGCGNVNFLNSSKPVIADPCDPEVEDCSSGKEPELHAIFKNVLGEEIPMLAMSTIQPDSTGLYPTDDYDGDGIPNDKEIFTNKYVANYPKIVTRIAPPIQMEIEVDYTEEEEDHVEFIEEDGLKDTITNSMENKQYSELNKKTTPYVTKESFEESASSANAYGYENSQSHAEAHERSSSKEWSHKLATGGTTQYATENQHSEGFSNSKKDEVSDSRSAAENSNVEKMFQQATMTEKTVFDDVDYIDNMDRHGVEFTSDTVQSISRNFRNRKEVLATSKVGPNAGKVTAGLFIRNASIDMPVKVSNIRCTLSFRTPSGENLPVQTFMLRNEDYSILEDVVTGGEELGPYTVSVKNLKTDTVQKALARGYMPQIHVVSYTMEKVEDSSYDPGVDNLKMVEEAAKSRTATIKVSGSGIRELYRVCAFDVNENGIDTTISPGISLKKALFNIFADKIGDGEIFIQDANGQPLTVPESGLRWKPGAEDRNEHNFSSNNRGNSWRLFETYVKAYTDEFNKVHYIETIKRIGSLKKYNPFSIIDNPSYDPNELLTNEEFFKTKYWIILHNGKYFEGDINDPIWAGERYEIICIDIRDFNNHFAFNSFFYSPIQTNEPLYFNTRWNNLNNEVTDQRVYPRARYLGKVVPSDVINLEINLLEARSLFNVNGPDEYDSLGNEVRDPWKLSNGDAGYKWMMGQLPYNFAGEEEIESGIPGEFSHYLKGGVNSIQIELTNSKNAHAYEISFPGTSLKNVRVSKSEVARNNGVVIISRETPAVNGTVGFIEGNKIYDVHVSAYGTAYGYEIPKESMFNNTSNSEVLVENPEGEELPGPFSFKASSTTNQINVAISDAENTEYYLIRYKGPLNLGVTPDDEGTTVLARAGLNQIKIDTPKGSATGEEAGLYLVEVVSANRYSVDPGFDFDLPVQFENLNRNSNVKLAPQYVQVGYDRFAVQKEMLAAKTGKLYDIRVLDNMEVNFNDGSGWYKLIFTNTDTHEGRKIDCRKSSYMNYAEQKFTISFKPPRGVEDAFGNIYNVFTGGKSEVDLYIRTMPKEKYRDRFWLKPGKTFESYGRKLDSYVTTPKIEKGIIDYWLNDGYYSTDATDIEDTIYQNESFVDKDIDNYFFSPFEYYSYSLKASITDILNEGEELCPDPVFDVFPGEHSIDISIQNSVGVDFYEVYYKIGNSFDPEKDDINGKNWEHVRFYESSGTISNLYRNTKYIVVVKAFNDFMESQPVPQGPIMPFSNEKPSKPLFVSARYRESTNSISVEDIYVDDEYRYKVQYKTLDMPEEEWITFVNPRGGEYMIANIDPSINIEDQDVGNTQDEFYGNDFVKQAFLNCELTKKVSPWKGHIVRVCAVSGSGVHGEWWVSEVLGQMQKYPTFELGADKLSIDLGNIYSSNNELMFDVEYMKITQNPLMDRWVPFSPPEGWIMETASIDGLGISEKYKVRVICRNGSIHAGEIITSGSTPIETTGPNFGEIANQSFAEWYAVTTSKRMITDKIQRGTRWACRRGKCKHWKLYRWVTSQKGIHIYGKLRIVINGFPESFKNVGIYKIIDGRVEGQKDKDDNSGTSEPVTYSFSSKSLPVSQQMVEIPIQWHGSEGPTFNESNYVGYSYNGDNVLNLRDVRVYYRIQTTNTETGVVKYSDPIEHLTVGNPSLK